jgi:simple sugar transport system permease protein
MCGVSAGILLALIHAVTVITFRANQIVSGIALNLFALGTTKYFCKLIFNSSSNSERIIGFENLQIPLFGSIPVLDNPFFLLVIAILILSHLTIKSTKFGLRLRAVGENPEAADSLGISVVKIRYIGVLISGLLAGLGGAWLAFNQHSFTDGMSAGRGYIALAAMIVGKWRPLGAALACLIFGFTESLTFQFQESAIPAQFIQMLPYAVTIIVLAGFIGKATPPAADGIPFEKNK